MESSDSVNIPGNIGDKYTLRGTIGKGSFSIVKLAFCLENNQYYACKIVPKSRLSSQSLQQRFENEIRIASQLRNPGIIQVYDLMKDDNNYYYIMEFCPNGELFNYVVERHHLDEDDAKNFMGQIFTTLKYVHSQGVAHRDLKLENLLLDSGGKVRIGDFGLSRFLDANGMAETPVGSPAYASPDVLSGLPYDGKKSDIWSCGVILYAIVTGQLPWTQRKKSLLFEQIKNGKYTIPSTVSPECGDLIQKLMCIDPKRRITLEEALSHPWMRQSKEGLGITTIPAPPPKAMSLRAVDAFFGREVSGEFENIPLEKSMSSSARTIEETLNDLHNRTRPRNNSLHEAGAKIAANDTLVFPKVGLSRAVIIRKRTSDALSTRMEFVEG